MVSDRHSLTVIDLDAHTLLGKPKRYSLLDEGNNVLVTD